MSGSARRDDPPAVALVDDVDAVVLAVGAGDAEEEREPAPEAEPPLAGERPLEDELVALAAEVPPGLLGTPLTNTSKRSPTPAGSCTRVRSATLVECHRPCAASPAPRRHRPLLALARDAAAAGNGGLAPVAPGLAERARHPRHLLADPRDHGRIFVLVEGALIVFIVRFRSRGRPREVEGPQIRGHTKLELALDGRPVVILLAIIAGFVFWKSPDIGATSSVPAADGRRRTRSRSRGTSSTGSSPTRTARSRSTRCGSRRPRRSRSTIRSARRQPQLVDPGARRQDRRDPRQDEPPRPSTRRSSAPSPGQCAEFCGLQHAVMLAHVEVLPADQYDAWVARARERAARARQGDLRRRLRQVPRPRGPGRRRPEHRAEPAARRQERALRASSATRHRQDARRRQRLVAGAARRADRLPQAALRARSSSGG